MSVAAAHAVIIVVPFTKPELKAIIAGTSLDDETYVVQNRGKRPRRSYTVAAERCTTWVNGDGVVVRTCCTGDKLIPTKLGASKQLTLHPFIVEPFCTGVEAITTGCQPPPGLFDLPLHCEAKPRGLFQAILTETSFAVDVDHTIPEVSESNNVDEAVYDGDGALIP